MKVQCSQHGCHFPQEFEQTLQPDCPYWHVMGASGMSIESRRKIWDWLFSMPADEIFITDNLQFSFSMSFSRTQVGTTFKEMVPGWEEMKEADRQLFEKEYFKDPANVSQIVNKAKVTNKLDKTKKVSN